MKTFKIPIIWEVKGFYQVKAENLKEAILQTQTRALPPGNLIPGTAVIDWNEIEGSTVNEVKETEKIFTE